MNTSPKMRLPWRRSLRAHLTVLFAALGLIPAVVVGYAVLRNLTQSIDVWENPGVTATMEGVRMVARTSVDKLVANLNVHARNAIESPALSGNLDDPATASRVLGRLRSETEVDLAALFARTGEDWIPVATEAADSIAFTSSDVRLALQLTSIQTGDQGYLVSAFRFEKPEGEHALLLGYRLGPEYLPTLESIAAGLTYYSQLRLVKQITRRSATLTAVTVTLIALGLAIVLGRWVAGGVSRPVEELVDGMQKLGRGENARVVPTGTDELRFLSRSFNRMARELGETRRELAKAERLAAWQEMARRIAHEIRNPLTPIQFALHRLQRRAAKGESSDPVEIQESVNAILEELDGLKSLAGTFSEFARLPDPEPVALQINDLIRSVAGLIEGQGAGVTLDLAADLPQVRGDRKGLRRVLTNLMKNALETGARTIVVHSRAVDGNVDDQSPGENARLGPGSVRSLFAEPHVVVTVEDDGPGVAQKSLDQIFMPDYSTKPQGTGLGLAIVCRIVAQHTGALVVERGEDRGVKMHVHLPDDRQQSL